MMKMLFVCSGSKFMRTIPLENESFTSPFINKTKIEKTSITL
jgi:hypothetical protein